MEAAAPTTTALPAWIARRPITVAEYHRMGEAGILREDERVELIEGEILAMSPIGSPHAGSVNTLNRLLVTLVGERGVVSVQNPVQLGDRSEPEPDFAILKPRDDDYFGAIPQTKDVLLLIEVSDSSLAYDRSVKRALYARHNIPELWVVDVAAGAVEICRAPAGDDYAEIVRLGRDGVLEPVSLPGVSIPAGAFLRGG
jgi:Uma2 family endonuclease